MQPPWRWDAAAVGGASAARTQAPRRWDAQALASPTTSPEEPAPAPAPAPGISDLAALQVCRSFARTATPSLPGGAAAVQ
jgi:hypothetical protein